jgi:hypothetical protein
MKPDSRAEVHDVSERIGGLPGPGEVRDHRSVLVVGDETVVEELMAATGGFIAADSGIEAGRSHVHHHG